jgi:hypothetical protein
MGIICSMKVVRFLQNEMMNKNISIKYLLTYKMSQDHIELFFGAIRLRNDCSFNPTPRQFRTAYRRLLVHAGRSISPTNGNCVAGDITCVPTVAWRTAASASDVDNIKSVVSSSVDLGEDFEMPHTCGCIVKNCKMCCAILAYIAGYHIRAAAKRLPCADCVSALYHSSDDPCSHVSLIHVKNFVSFDKSNYNCTSKGLTVPSGSVMKIILESERQVRDYRLNLSNKNLLHTLTNNTMKQLAGVELFPTLISHMYDADGIDSHYWLLIKTIVKNFIVCRIKKMCKDIQQKSKNLGLGNKLQRTRIFMNK